MQLQRIHHKSKTTYMCPNKVQYHIIILLHFLNMVTSQHLSKMGATTLKLTEFEPTTFACPERRGELFSGVLALTLWDRLRLDAVSVLPLLKNNEQTSLQHLTEHGAQITSSFNQPRPEDFWWTSSGTEHTTDEKQSETLGEPSKRFLTTVWCYTKDGHNRMGMAH